MILTADRPTLVVAADHAHVDMWSLLVILRDLVQGLGGTLPAGTVRPFAEHTAALADREPAPDQVRQRWAEILAAGGDVMPRFPLPLGELTPAPPERVEVRDVLGVDDCALFERRARSSGVSTLALVTSVMTRTTRELAHAPLRAVFPVHSRYDDRWHGSVGWFITNAVIDAGDPDPRACADAVREAVRLGSWPLDDVLAPWGGMPEAPGMFAISWLDLRRLPVRIDHAGLEAQYVSSAGDADGVMVWFILDEAGLHLRCRYPDTDEARENVGAWLDRVVDGVRASAHPAGADVVLAGGRLVVDRATRADVPAVVALLSGAGDTADPDDPDLAPYEGALRGGLRRPGPRPRPVPRGRPRRRRPGGRDRAAHDPARARPAWHDPVAGRGAAGRRRVAAARGRVGAAGVGARARARPRRRPRAGRGHRRGRAAPVPGAVRLPARPGRVHPAALTLPL